MSAQVDDSVGASDRDGAVRRCKNRATGFGEPLPHLELGVDIERARQVVEYQEFGPVNHRPSSGRSLKLTAAQTNAASADHRAEPIRQGLDVAFECGECDAGTDRLVIEVVPEAQIVEQ